MGTGENREADHVHVFLHRLRDDLLGRALEPRVDDLEAGVAQRLHDDLGAAVVPVEAGLRDQDFHWSREPGSRRGWPARDGRGTVTPGPP